MARGDSRVQVQIQADTQDIKKKLDELNEKLDGLGDSAEGAGDGLGSAFSKLKIGAAAAVVAMGAALKKSIEISAEFEFLETRLTSLYGSTQRGAEAFKRFNDVAATTPFQLKNVVEAGAQLKAFGVDAENMIGPVADLAAFMGMDVTEAANAMGRAFAGGAGAADILRERGILNLIKDFKGIDDITELTLPEFREAMMESLQDPAVGIAGSTERLSNTFTGAMSNMQDAVARLGDRIGDGLRPQLTGMIKSFTNLISIPVSQNLIEEQTEFNALVKILQDVNTKASTREAAIKDLQDKYPDYLGNIDLEKVGYEELEKALKDANQEFERKIKLAAAEEILKEKAEDLKSVQLELFEAEKKLNAARGSNFVQIDDLLSKEEMQAQKVSALRANVERLVKEYESYKQALVDQNYIVNENNEVTDEQSKKTEKKKQNVKDETDLIVESAASYDEWLEKQRALVEAKKQEAEWIDVLKEEYPELAEKMGLVKKETEDTTYTWLSFKDALNEAAAASVLQASSITSTSNALGAASQAAKQAAGSFISAEIQKAVASFIRSQISSAGPMGWLVAPMALAGGAAFGSLMGSAIQRIQFAATGMDEMVTQPTMIIAGEAGAEHVKITPSAQMGQSGGGSGPVINFHGDIIGTREFIQDKIIPQIREVARLELS